MKLYEISDIFAQLFDELESYDTWEPQKNDYGEYIDEHGELIAHPSQYISDTRKALKEAWFESLSLLEEDFDDKAVNIAMYIKSLEAEAEAMKREKQNLEVRQKAKERRAASLREYLIESMKKIQKKKIDQPRASISLQQNPESVDISEMYEKTFVAWAQSHDHDDLLSYKSPTIAKTAVKQAIKDGAQLPPYVKIVRTMRVIIK